MLTRTSIRGRALAPAVLAITACSTSNGSTPNVADSGPADASMSNPGSNLPIVTLSEASAPSSGGQSVTCGSKTCTAPAGGMVQNNACCLPDNSCGAFPDLSSVGGFGAAAPSPAGDAGGACLDVTPGTPDPSCPSQSVMGFSLAGCCSKAGVCGVDLSIGGLGCNPLSALGALASLDGVADLDGGAMDAEASGLPQTCGDGGGVPNDGSVSDAPSTVADAASE